MKNEKWIIPTAAILLVAVLGLAIWGAYAAVDRLFPMADPIQYPAAEEIVSASLSENNGSCITLEGESISVLLEKMQNAQPTREMSINDYPVVGAYYTIEFTTEQRMRRYFVYLENGNVYVEAPYTGIYKADSDLPAWLGQLLQGE